MRAAGVATGASTLSLDRRSKRVGCTCGVFLAGTSFALLGMSGCATRADLEQLRQSHLQARRIVADQSVALEDLRRRVEMLRAASDESPSAARDDAAWRTRVESRLGALERQPVSVVPESAAIAADEASGRTPGVAPVTAQVVPVVIAPGARATGGDLASALSREDELLRTAQVDPDYRSAIDLVRADRCGDAIPQFQAIVRKNVRSPFADKAQYWIGRCFQIQGDHNRAVRELYDVILKFPQSDRVPAALLVLADAFAAAGDDIDARLALRKVVSEHPNAAEAEVARQRLRALGE